MLNTKHGITSVASNYIMLITGTSMPNEDERDTSIGSFRTFYFGRFDVDGPCHIKCVSLETMTRCAHRQDNQDYTVKETHVQHHVPFGHSGPTRRPPYPHPYLESFSHVHHLRRRNHRRRFHLRHRCLPI
jgi:hypothetical protein